MSLYSALTDLFRQVANVLQPEHGGTGSTYGEERVVVRAVNSTGSNLRLYSAVKPTFGANDLRITPIAEANSTTFLGSVVGYYGGDGALIEADAPDGYEVAVQTGGVARFLISSNVTRAQYAFTTTSAGKIASSTSGSGAFGLVLDTAWLTQTSNARVFISAQGAVSAGGWDAIVTKAIDESVTSSTTLQDDDELQYTTVSGGFYQWECLFWMACPGAAGAPDIKYAFGEDNTFRGYYFTVKGNAGTGATEVVSSGAALTTTNTAQTGTDKFAINNYGTLTGNGGNFRLQWAQNGSNVSPVIVYAGSTLKVKRLA